jgi:hypothetical protein
MRLLTPVIQKMGRQKVVLLGAIEGISIAGEVYEVRNNEAVSYLFIDTDRFSVGRVELIARDRDGTIRKFALSIQAEPVDLNYDVLNTPINGYRTNTEINNETLQMPFEEVQGKFDALVDQLRRQGIIL